MSTGRTLISDRVQLKQVRELKVASELKVVGGVNISVIGDRPQGGAPHLFPWQKTSGPRISAP